MKKIYLVFWIISWVISSVFATPINECKIDIYFGNGIWNDPDGAEENRKALEDKILILQIIKNDPALKAKYGKVKLAYNWSGSAMIDLLETYYQLKEEGQVNDLEFFMVMMIITGGNAELSTYATGVLMEAMPFVAEAEQSNVDEMLEQYYNESFRYSHRVLLVSHSQGNLFANRVYDSIDPTGYKTYFANVQVASPASSVHAAKGTYITGRIDPVINPIPGSMGHNAKLDGLGGHRFVAAYLDSKDTYQKIVQAIKEELAALDDPSQTPSQWKIVKEPEDRSSCEAIRVEMAHRFDESLGPVEDVYPFETDAAIYKLYPAADEDGASRYVLDRCGGKTIKEDWEDKKENACYLLDPLGDVIKTGNFVYYLQMGRPWASVYSTVLYLCRADLQHFAASRQCVVAANGAQGDGYSIWDVFNEGPCQGYDRYADSKWAGTEYAGIFNDMILTTVPFEEASGWACSNYNEGCCTCNGSNFKTYYQLSWSDLFANAYETLKGE